MFTKSRLFVRIIALMLSVVLLSQVTAYATANSEISEIVPRASDYLSSYNTYIYQAALGKIQVWFAVTGVNYMDTIGVLKVYLYESTDNENWTHVKTFNHDSTSGMLGTNKVYHSGHVEYSGKIGRYYKAYVCIWAGKDGDGDTRYMWTQPKKATLLPA